MKGHLGQRNKPCSDHLGWYVPQTTEDLAGETGRGQNVRGSWASILEAAGDCWNILSRKSK